MRDEFLPETARHTYDRLGGAYGWAEHFESRAKHRALEGLDLSANQRVLNVGAGTGKDQLLIQAVVGTGGLALALDISRVMLKITHARSRTPVCQGDARQMPLANASFDRLFCSYVLDLMPTRDLPLILAEFRRVLQPEGRLALVTLTEGIDGLSRALIAAWRLVYTVSPVACGGCRPLHVSDLVREAGFAQVSQETVVQLGVPSEVVLARVD